MSTTARWPTRSEVEAVWRESEVERRVLERLAGSTAMTALALAEAAAVSGRGPRISADVAGSTVAAVAVAAAGRSAADVAARNSETGFATLVGEAAEAVAEVAAFAPAASSDSAAAADDVLGTEAETVPTAVATVAVGADAALAAAGRCYDGDAKVRSPPSASTGPSSSKTPTDASAGSGRDRPS